jgi:uracil-DNA glycosylase
MTAERASQDVYPAEEKVFNAFRMTPYGETKVVILGQDPYHGAGQAHGLSFSVEGETTLPPSLKNIYRELADDIGCQTPATGDLSSWARQGVFLLNTVLTVRDGEPNSHRKQGWEKFTDFVIEQLNRHPQCLVFLLWGKPAEKKATLIDPSRHAVIVSPHPSPLSAHRGFFGSRPFSKANAALASTGRETIDWAVKQAKL